MKTAIECSLLLSVATGLVYLFLPSIKKWSGRVFLATLTIFVAVTLGSVQHSLKEAPAPSLDLDQAELSLKMLSAFRATQGKLSSGDLHNAISAVQYQGAPISQVLINKVYGQVVLSLEQRLPGKQADLEPPPLLPKEIRTLAEIAVVCGDSDDAALHPKLLRATRQLSLSSKPESRSLGQALAGIYTAEQISKVQAGQFEEILQSNLPSGWYRNQALERLYRSSGQTGVSQKLKASTDTAALAFAHRTIGLLMTMSIAALIGIITILIFLATEPRHAGNNAPVPGNAATPWSLTTTYGVLVGWVATQLVAQSMIVAAAKPQLKHILQASSASTAGITMFLYLLTTVPALLYIWWFACRPFKLHFVDAVRLKLNTAAANFFQLAGCGVLTWCAAIPIVLGSQLLSLKLFSSQGSSNPVLSLVRDAAHSPSILPVAIYFLILGLLAPVAEETLFRGFVYSSLRTKLGKFTAAAGSAALFALAHLDPGAFISLFALGFLFALVRERYQSILPSIIAHGMWNCGTFILVLVLFSS